MVLGSIGGGFTLPSSQRCKVGIDDVMELFILGQKVESWN